MSHPPAKTTFFAQLRHYRDESMKWLQWSTVALGSLGFCGTAFYWLLTTYVTPNLETAVFLAAGTAVGLHLAYMMGYLLSRTIVNRRMIDDLRSSQDALNQQLLWLLRESLDGTADGRTLRDKLEELSVSVERQASYSPPRFSLW